MIPEVEGTRPWGSSRKRVPKCLKGPKITYTTIAIAKKKNSPREVKRDHFVIYWVLPPGPTQEMELMRTGGEGPSRSPGFSSHERNYWSVGRFVTPGSSGSYTTPLQPTLFDIPATRKTTEL